MGDPTGGASTDRYTALVAALLGVRTDYASSRFDAEVAAALAANRLDVATARTLRWWQRASVREVEGYVGTVVPAALATRTEADTVAAMGNDESATAWEQAQVVLPEAAAVPAVPVEAPKPSRVITIPDPSTRRRSANEIQQAVREALRATAPPVLPGQLNPGQQDPGLPFDVPSQKDASSHGRDRGHHAHSAPLA
jgi:hypothetical protein